MTAFFRPCCRFSRSVCNYTTKDTNDRHGGLFQAVEVLLACARIPHGAISAYLCKKRKKRYGST